MGFSGLWKILESIIVRPPTFIDVIEGVWNPLLLQHSIPLFTQEERLATAGERPEGKTRVRAVFIFSVASI